MLFGREYLADELQPLATLVISQLPPSVASVIVQLRVDVHTVLLVIILIHGETSRLHKFIHSRKKLCVTVFPVWKVYVTVFLLWKVSVTLFLDRKKTCL